MLIAAGCGRSRSCCSTRCIPGRGDPAALRVRGAGRAVPAAGSAASCWPASTGYAHGHALPPARGAGPGPDPGAGRDRHDGDVRAGAAPDAGPYFSAPAVHAHALGADRTRARCRGSSRGAGGRLARVPGSPSRRCRSCSPTRPSAYGGGSNIVNVTLVDIRAWDTMGEISVLVVAATGVASLIFLVTGRRRSAEPCGAAAPPRRRRARWLRAGRRSRNRPSGR